MSILISIVVGVLFAAGVYLMMRRTIVQLLLGLGMIGNAANLMIFNASGLQRSRPPLVPEGGTVPPTPHADPVPQALILTAIVISFGVIAFALALADRAHREVGSDHVGELRSSDE
ncbi:MAG: Na+/H+ antiporter subunit C [Fimbriimonas sp.]